LPIITIVVDKTADWWYTGGNNGGAAMNVRLSKGSFLRGFRSAFDITGRTLVSAPDVAKSGIGEDREALAKDWKAIEGDFRRALGMVIDARK
jgi:hypothetical protein